MPSCCYSINSDSYPAQASFLKLELRDEAGCSISRRHPPNRRSKAIGDNVRFISKMLSYGGGVAVLATVTLLASSLASGVAEAATAQPATATVSARAGSSIVTRPSAIATP